MNCKHVYSKYSVFTLNDHLNINPEWKRESWKVEQRRLEQKCLFIDGVTTELQLQSRCYWFLKVFQKFLLSIPYHRSGIKQLRAVIKSGLNNLYWPFIQNISTFNFCFYFIAQRNWNQQMKLPRTRKCGMPLNLLSRLNKLRLPCFGKNLNW